MRGRAETRWFCSSALENLVKGAARQAVQTMNLMFEMKTKWGMSSGT